MRKVLRNPTRRMARPERRVTNARDERKAGSDPDVSQQVIGTLAGLLPNDGLHVDGSTSQVLRPTATNTIPRVDRRRVTVW